MWTSSSHWSSFHRLFCPCHLSSSVISEEFEFERETGNYSVRPGRFWSGLARAVVIKGGAGAKYVKHSASEMTFELILTLVFKAKFLVQGAHLMCFYYPSRQKTSLRSQMSGRKNLYPALSLRPGSSERAGSALWGNQGMSEQSAVRRRLKARAATILGGVALSGSLPEFVEVGEA